MRIELRNDKINLDGYVNVVARDSKIMLDSNGERFVEQIKPKTFQRAIEKTNNIFCYLNHDESKVLASTKDGNIELFEDNIGLRAICEITNQEIIEKAKEQKLSGWSFGFEMLKKSEENLKNGIKRRFIEDMNLLEVSILDSNKIPAYVGTSIETRSHGDKIKDHKIEYRCQYFKPKYFDLNQKLEKDVEPPEMVAFNFFDYENFLNNF